jgi:type IV secretory pathway VirB2 component (pilin)
MSFRRLNQRFLAPASQTLMILGIIALCQPWVLFLHRYGVTIILVGLISFMITSKIAPEAEAEPEAE